MSVFDLKMHLTRQIAWSRATFGPSPRTKGIFDHMEKEKKEILSAPDARERTKEWVDLVILALDGLWRSVAEQYKFKLSSPAIARTVVNLIEAKQSKNELRDWPDWRTLSEDQAIEHTRTAIEEKRKSEELAKAALRPKSFDPDEPDDTDPMD